MQLLKRTHTQRRKTWILLVVCLISVGGVMLGWVVLHQAGQGSLWSAKRATVLADTANWKTYTDLEHGFALRYPAEWNRLPTPSENTRGESAGIKINTYTVYPCNTTADYLSKKYPPSYPDMTRKSLHVGSVDGFMVERQHLKTREVVLLNCPYAIHIGLNPTGIPNADQLFSQVLSTVRVWKPVQQPKN